MSKIGKKPVDIVDGVTIQIDGKLIVVKWPKGQLQYELLDGVNVEQKENQLFFSVESDELKNLRGLSRTLIANMVEWVTNWYEKKLLVIGVWYSAKAQGKIIDLQLWLSHPVNFPLPDAVEASTEKDPKGNDIITLTSIDKQLVGEVAAKIRSLRKPDPYKGKWIRYTDEIIKLKPGKAAKK